MIKPEKYILAEWARICAIADRNLGSRCQLLEDEVYSEINKYINRLIMGDGTVIKPCPDCGSPLIPLSSTAERKCSGCPKCWPWKLSDGQKPVGYSVCPEKIEQITEEISHHA